jgi:hypothetical protein
MPPGTSAGVGPITYLGAFSGLRRAEVLGLRFASVRWFDNEIGVQYAISKRRCLDGIHKWEWYLGPPKTRKSLRGRSQGRQRRFCVCVPRRLPWFHSPRPF